MKTAEIILSSGEYIRREDVLRNFMALAEAEASFPLLCSQDYHLACLLLLPDVLEQAENDMEERREARRK